MIDDLLYILLGIVAGMLSGLIGAGGGVIIVPALVFLFGFTQHQAQGTTLAVLVPPVGLPAAWTYFKHGSINLEVAVFVCIGFFLGGYLGAKFATGLSSMALERRSTTGRHSAWFAMGGTGKDCPPSLNCKARSHVTSLTRNGSRHGLTVS